MSTNLCHSFTTPLFPCYAHYGVKQKVVTFPYPNVNSMLINSGFIKTPTSPLLPYYA